jgi:hypothetical protein
MLGKFVKPVSIPVVAFVCAMTFYANAANNAGEEKISIPGGSMGKINFPHHLHQEVLENCLICHNVFPKEKGAIERLKKEKLLRKKQVMNASCIACHRKNKKAGKKYGPVSCKKCHAK